MLNSSLRTIIGASTYATAMYLVNSYREYIGKIFITWIDHFCYCDFYLDSWFQWFVSISTLSLSSKVHSWCCCDYSRLAIKVWQIADLLPLVEKYTPEVEPPWRPILMDGGQDLTHKRGDSLFDSFESTLRSTALNKQIVSQSHTDVHTESPEVVLLERWRMFLNARWLCRKVFNLFCG